MPDLDIPGVVRALNAHRVRYVVIGGVAALVHNLSVPATVDIDVTPSRDPKNLDASPPPAANRRREATSSRSTSRTSA